MKKYPHTSLSDEEYERIIHGDDWDDLPEELPMDALDSQPFNAMAEA